MAGRVLVAHASKHGSTTGVAEAVARELLAAGWQVDVAEFSAVDSLGGFDAAVLGAPLYLGRPLGLAPFVASHRDILSGMPVAAFAVGLTPAAPRPEPEQVERARKALIDGLSPLRPVAATLFAGALEPAAMGFAERAMVRLLRAPTGDFRDWDAIGAWARAVLPLLRGATGDH